MDKKSKKTYLMSEICKKVINCDFRKEFHSYFYNYFPDKSDCWDFKYKLKPIGKVGKNDFKTVWNNLKTYYGEVEYFKDLKKAMIGLNNKVNNGVLRMNKLDYDEDYLVSNYLEYWNNLNYIAIYGYKKRWDERMEQIIADNGDLLVVRDMDINRREMMGLLFWGNLRKSKYKTYGELSEVCKHLGLKDDEGKVKVRIYFFERDVLKTRDDIDFMKKRIEVELGDKESIEGKLYGGFNYDEAVSYGMMVLNITNLRYFNEMCWDRFLDMSNGAGKLMIIGIRNYLLERIDAMNMKRFLIFSSMILFLYGLRRPSDIDILGYDKPKSDKNINRLYDEYASQDRRILGIGELQVRGYGDWREGGKKEYLNVWFGYEWARKFGARDMEDMIFNPRYYVSLVGLKVITLSADMERRRIRYRPAAYADMLAYNYFMPEPMEIEPPPKRYIVQGEEKSYETVGEIKELLRKIKCYLKLRYDIRMTIEELGGELGVSEKIREVRSLRDERILKRLKIYDKLRKIR